MTATQQLHHLGQSLWLYNAVLAREFQREGTRLFTQSWLDLMDRIASKSAVLTQTRPEGAKP